MAITITTEEQLRIAIEATESEHLEFKSAANNYPSEDLFRYCVALANEGGGTLILGVSNKRPRKIEGTACFDDLNKIKTRLLDTLKFRVDVFELLLPEGRVLAINCPSRPLGTPRHYNGQYMMRAGESLLPMTSEKLASIMNEATLDFSRSICSGATLGDLDSDAIQEFQSRWVRKSGNQALAQTSHLQLLSDAHLVVDGNVTFAALILFGKAASLSRFLPQAELIFEYRSSAGSIEYQDRAEYRAGFFLWINLLWDKINARNEKFSYREGLFRYDFHTFNEEVVREALLNAITHRDYQDGRSIFVRQFPENLEVTSPGGFPSGITEQNIIYRQNPRNRTIAEALQFCGLVERSGQGADRMYKVSIQEGKSRPDYSKSDNSQVMLVLSGHVKDPRFIDYLNRLASERGMSLTIDDFLVLDSIREGLPVPADLRPRLAALVEQGVVEKTGKGRGVHHVLSYNLYRHVGESGTYTRRKGLDDEHNQQLLLNHIGHCGSKGATLTEFKQVLPSKSSVQVRGLLAKLKKQGRITVSGKTRGARWFLP